jgi:hypothetical protein
MRIHVWAIYPGIGTVDGDKTVQNDPEYKPYS